MIEFSGNYWNVVFRMDTQAFYLLEQVFESVVLY